MTTNPFDTPPRWLRLDDGRMVATHERIISDAVWLAREDDLLPDGRMRAGPVTIHLDAPDTLDAAGARALAAGLVEAAELAEHHAAVLVRRRAVVRAEAG
jgi:hypothetical protein